MSLFFEDFHIQLRDSIRRFAESELKPVAEKLDEEQGFNEKAFRALG
jgi:alkylation response protein AidB-like acyl-CoA dehydrogenase